jgi:hypothetical protein
MARAINNIKGDIAEDEVNKDLDKELLEEVRNFTGKIDYGKAHKCKIRRRSDS